MALSGGWWSPVADTVEMVRLINHAAKLLEFQTDNLLNERYSGRSVVAAMSSGAAILRMVAACMADEPAVEPQLTEVKAAGIDSIVERLRVRRAELRVSQRELARRLGTQQSAVSEWESGQVSPRLSTVRRWAQALDSGSVVDAATVLATYLPGSAPSLECEDIGAHAGCDGLAAGPGDVPCTCECHPEMVANG